MLFVAMLIAVMLNAGVAMDVKDHHLVEKETPFGKIAKQQTKL